MVELFLQTAQWSEAQFLALNYALVIIGFLLAKAVLPARKPIGRITFLLGLSLFALLFAVLDGGWLYLTVGHRYGMLEGMILTLFLLPAFHGAALQQISSARAADMWGSSGKDWIALVPFGVIVFVFKPGEKAAAAQDAPYSTGRATLRVLRDCALVLLSLAAFMTSRVVIETTEDSPLAYSAEVEQMWAEVTNTLSPSSQFKLEVAGTRPLLPFTLDSQTTLIAIRAADDHLYLTYRYKGYAEDLSDYHGLNLSDDACAADMFRSALMQGGTVHYEYTGGANVPIRDYTITAADCPSGIDS